MKKIQSNFFFFSNSQDFVLNFFKSKRWCHSRIVGVDIIFFFLFTILGAKNALVGKKLQSDVMAAVAHDSDF